MRFSKRWQSLRSGCRAAGLILLLCTIILAQNDTVTVDADGGADFTSLNDVIEEIQSLPRDVREIRFVGSDQDTFTWTYYVNESPGDILLVGMQEDPDLFPVIDFDADTYAFGNNNNIAFENLIFTGKRGIDLGQGDKTHTFKKCVFRDFNGDGVIIRYGNSGGTTIIENCLFEGNTATRVLEMNYWAGTDHTLIMTNCTFDNNNAIWMQDEDYASQFTIFNCIFSNNGTTFPGDNLRGVTTYSLTDESLTGYGTGCKSDDPDYMVSSRSTPSDWCPSPESPARNMGIATGAPSVDISSTARIHDEENRRDAGCWDIYDTVQPPEITDTFPSDTSVAEGTDLTLSLTVSGTEPFFYRWYRLGDEDEPVDTSASFVIEDITAEEDGESFFCIVFNSIDTAYSDTVGIYIVISPVITVHPDTIGIYEGEDTTFSITATGEPDTYIWLRDNVTITGETDDSYTITDAAADDSGALFVCIAENIAGSDTSRPGLLRVYPSAARIEERTDDTTLTEGSSITLSVVATGKPVINYAWNLVGDSAELSDSATLRLTDLEPVDSMRYRCIVTNDDGEDTTYVKLIVLGGEPPEFTAVPKPENGIRIGFSDTFTVSADGNTPLWFTWYKNGTGPDDSIAAGEDLVLSSVTEDDSGSYYCIVRNTFGSDTTGPVTVTIITTTIYNVIELAALFIDPLQVRLSLSGYTGFPSSDAESPYVDSVGIWYDDLTFPSVPLSSDAEQCLKLSLDEMLAGAAETFDTVLHLSEVSDECNTLYFVAAPIWKEPDSIPPDISSMQRASVKMCSSDTIENLLVPVVTYNSVSDSIVIAVSNLTSINRDSLMYLILEYELSSGTPADMFIERITPAELPGASTDILMRVYKDSLFSGIEDTVVVRVTLRGIMGNFSAAKSKSVVVGKKRPVNTAQLNIDTATVDEIQLSWSFSDTTTVDSIRIWWGLQQVPLAADFNGDLYRSVLLEGGLATAVISDGVVANTRYHIGLQILRDGIWSIVTENARDSVVTGKIYGDTIPNTIKLTSLTFDTSTNLITVEWDVDTAGIGSTDSLETGIVWSAGSTPPPGMVPETSGGVTVTEITVTGNSHTIDIGEDLLFSTTYHFALLLRRKNDRWEEPTDSSRGTVFISGPVWQEIFYFLENDTVSAFNDQARIWKQGTGTVSVTDTLRAFYPDTIPEGFVLACNFGIDFKNDVRSDPIHIGLKYDTLLLQGLSPDAIRVYQYNAASGVWSVLDNVSISVGEQIVSVLKRTNDWPDPFILMVDTLRPVVYFTSDTATSVVNGEDVYDTLVIYDNIVNSTVRIFYWDTSNTDDESGKWYTCNKTPDTIITRIPGDSITSDRGIKALMVPSDGRFTSITDISRTVIRDNSDPVTLQKMRWSPVATTADLNAVSIEDALKGLCEGDEWKYDSIHFRIFRWIDTAKASSGVVDTGDFWVEYSSNIGDIFDVVPGRVFWIKPLETSFLAGMGNGTTVSLKQPYAISLKAEKWNDIALPFKFNVKIGDIINETGKGGDIRGKIAIYRWVVNDSNNVAYTTQKHLDIGGLDSSAFPLVYNAAEGEVGTYSFYNSSDQDIILKIPPIPAVFSDVTSSGAAAAKRRAGNEWSLVVRARTDDGEVTPVYCAYRSGDENKTFPVAPTFRKQHIHIVDRNKKTVYGNMLLNKPENGGFVFPLRFENRDDHTALFEYEIEEVVSIPDGYHIGVYDPSEKRIKKSLVKQNVEVTAHSSQSRWMLVGDTSFIAGWYRNASVGFSLVRMYPNPCRGELIIRFILPYDNTRNVTIAVFDQLGRSVWNRTVTRSLMYGTNTVQWNPRKSRSPLGAGTYLIRVTAFDGSGKSLGTRVQRIVYMP